MVWPLRRPVPFCDVLRGRRILMVGDSEVDVATGRVGGAAACIGVRDGGGDPVGADVVVASIDAIEVVAPEPG